MYVIFSEEKIIMFYILFDNFILKIYTYIIIYN